MKEYKKNNAVEEPQKFYDIFGREVKIGDIVISVYTMNSLSLCINKVVDFTKTFGKWGMVFDTWNGQKYMSEVLILRRGDGTQFFNNGMLMPKGYSMDGVEKYFQ